MCGIIGYVGFRDAVPILLEGLERLEYRGYDSAGIAVLNNDKLTVEKKSGKVKDLEKYITPKQLSGTIGLAHTRWATHGEPNDINAHPHYDCKKEIALIHNGIIENYKSIKTKLINDGHKFISETDTEAIVHLIETMLNYTDNFESAIQFSLNQLEGAFGLAVISSREPEKLFVARKGSPLVIGIGEKEFFIASDAAAIVKYTRKVIYLNDNEMATLTASGYSIKTIGNTEIKKEVEEINFDLQKIEKAGFPHFMLKEIYEQPEALQNSMRGRIIPDEKIVKLGGLQNASEAIVNSNRIIITACGTSWHAGLVAKYMLEQYAGIETDVEYASEFRYRNPIIKKNDVVLLISQSGETADTLAALRISKENGATALGLVNVVGSSIARESDAGVYIHAGPEIGVASTKAFTSQLIILSLLTVFIAQKRNVSGIEHKKIIEEIPLLSNKIRKIFENVEEIKKIAEEYKDSTNFLYLGRGYNFPVALEGALKLKEISYIHAEGYPAAEMKHGPIALIDENMPVVCIAPKDETYEKILSNIIEVRSRKGKIIAIADEDDKEISGLAEHVIRIPHTMNLFTPILSVIPLQLLAYYIAIYRGCDVDQPRNLAKSVTVE